MKPWMIAIQLQALAMGKLDMRADLGIDKHFLDDAHKDKKGKTVVQIESAKEQLEMLSGFGDELEEKFLLSTLDENDKMKPTLESLIGAWLKGDADKIDSIVHKDDKDHPEFEPVRKKHL